MPAYFLATPVFALSAALTPQILGGHGMSMGENGITSIERLESVCHMTFTQRRTVPA
jgi:hypothetical protein